MAILTNYHLSVLTGGASNALDGVDGAALLDGDRAYMIVTGVWSVWYLNATSGAADNGATIIAPDVNPGLKRWIKCT